jgi:hypothetical protein
LGVRRQGESRLTLLHRTLLREFQPSFSSGVTLAEQQEHFACASPCELPG